MHLNNPSSILNTFQLHSMLMMMMMKWCLMSSDVSWHISDKLWPMPKHGSIILYVHGPRRLVRTDRPGRPPRLSHSSWTISQHVVVADRFYIALFSALEQTHCARMWFYTSGYRRLERVFEYPPKWSTYSAGMAAATWNCCHLGAFCSTNLEIQGSYSV